jgi:hypothetical protein
MRLKKAGTLARDGERPTERSSFMPSEVDEADLLYVLWLPGPRVFVIQDFVAHAAGRAAQLFALNKIAK